MINGITILMATYNGEKFIEEQLDSIISQTYKNWRLIIRDDCSTDNTVDVICRYVSQNDNIELICGNENVGQIKNFEELLKLDTGDDFVMFCDQDDVWKNDKIEKTLEMMQREENLNSEKPIMIYTKKTFVDSKMNLICNEIVNLKNDFFSILCQNPVYGCTAMINSRLKEKIIPFPKYITCHDYWAALIASSEGVLRLLDYESIYYRQHSGNVTGGINNYSLLNKFKRFGYANRKIEKTIIQNYRFCIDFALNNNEAKKYVKIIEKPHILRAAYAILKGYRLNGVMATARNLLVLSKVEIKSNINVQ